MKNLTLGFLVLAVLASSLVLAYDASTPYTVTMKWIVPEDSSFTVELCGAETTIDFDTALTSDTVAWAQPNCQDNATSTAMYTITNTGNIALNFTNNLTAAKPAWATLYVNNDTIAADAVEFDTDAVIIAGNVAIDATRDIYLWTTITSADTGTTERTYQVNSEKFLE